MPTFNLGRYKIVPKGDYSHTETYMLLDLVTFNGSSWLCRIDNTTATYPPTNMVSNEYWQLVGAKGDSIVTLTDAQIATIVAQVEGTGNFVTRSEYTATDNNFTDEDKEAVENIGNGNITISRNNVKVDTFNVNTGTDKTININVPTSLDDLNIDKAVMMAPDVKEDAESTEVKMTIDDDAHFAVYTSEIKVVNVVLPYTTYVEAAKYGRYQVVITLSSGLSDYTASTIIKGTDTMLRTYDPSTTLLAGKTYMIDVYMNIIDLKQLY